MKKGIFIVIEGPDRSGKTTQANLLKKWLEKRNKKVILTREPGGTKLSEEIRKILLNPDNNISSLTELFLYEAARAQHVHEKILPAIKSGKIVICDRFTMATEAYQGYGRGLDLKKIKKLNDIATQGLKPDLTIVMLMPDSEFKKRQKTKLYGLLKEKIDRIEKENSKFRKRVNLAYKKLSLRGKNILKIDATKNIEDINEEIKSKIQEIINL